MYKHPKVFCVWTGILFAVIAIFHLLRAAYEIPVTIGTWSVPIWLSYLAFVVVGYLGFAGFHFAGKKKK
jgi:hypothetical protein